MCHLTIPTARPYVPLTDPLRTLADTCGLSSSMYLGPFSAHQGTGFWIVRLCFFDRDRLAPCYPSICLESPANDKAMSSSARFPLKPTEEHRHIFFSEWKYLSFLGLQCGHEENATHQAFSITNSAQWGAIIPRCRGRPKDSLVVVRNAMRGLGLSGLVVSGGGGQEMCVSLR